MHDFRTAPTIFLTGHEIKARTHAHVEIMHFPTQPAALCFPGPDDTPHWEMCNFCTGMRSCYSLVGQTEKSTLRTDDVLVQLILKQKYHAWRLSCLVT